MWARFLWKVESSEMISIDETLETTVFRQSWRQITGAIWRGARHLSLSFLTVKLALAKSITRELISKFVWQQVAQVERLVCGHIVLCWLFTCNRDHLCLYFGVLDFIGCFRAKVKFALSASFCTLHRVHVASENCYTQIYILLYTYIWCLVLFIL